MASIFDQSQPFWIQRTLQHDQLRDQARDPRSGVKSYTMTTADGRFFTAYGKTPADAVTLAGTIAKGVTLHPNVMPLERQAMNSTPIAGLAQPAALPATIQQALAQAKAVGMTLSASQIADMTKYFATKK